MQATAILSRWQHLSAERRRHLLLALLGTTLSWVLAGLMAARPDTPAPSQQGLGNQVVRSADASHAIQQTQQASALRAQP